jgi:quercetin dioxygenase-like cupin family protein
MESTPKPDITFGNAQTDGADRRGWFMGHFIDTANQRSTEILEVKWGTHAAGARRSEWSVNQVATTLSILIKGQFRFQFPDQECLLAQEGDYVIWAAGVPHTRIAELASTVVTVRYPSKEGDSIEKAE